MSDPSVPPPPLHELESEVMDVMWDLGEATVRDVLVRLNGESGRERAYTTIMTIMRRLDTKGVLERERHGKTDVYRPRDSREDYLEARARAEVSALVEEFGDVALTHFAQEMAKLDPQRRDRLRRMARRRA
jgi:predicted transcriptional regulator